MKVKGLANKITLVFLPVICFCISFCSTKQQKLNEYTITKKTIDVSNSTVLEDVKFFFVQKDVHVVQGTNVELKARMENNKTTNIYIANWGLGITYYWQNNYIITASVLPFGYARPKEGVGSTGGSPSVLYPQFRELKRGEATEILIKVPPGLEKEWLLSKGKWRLKLQHLWVSDPKMFETLSGEQLVTELKRKGNFVWAYADVVVQ